MTPTYTPRVVHSSTPIPDLALDLCKKGMADNAQNLIALGANPDAAHGWEKWRKENPTTAVSQAFNKVLEESRK